MRLSCPLNNRIPTAHPSHPHRPPRYTRGVLKRLMGEEDTRLALLVGWGFVLPVVTVFSYYFGTIAVSKHVYDLQREDMMAAIPYGVGGFAIGLAFAVFATFIYPRLVFGDLDREAHAHREDESGYHGHTPGEEPDLMQGHSTG